MEGKREQVFFKVPLNRQSVKCQAYKSKHFGNSCIFFANLFLNVIRMPGNKIFKCVEYNEINDISDIISLIAS